VGLDCAGILAVLLVVSLLLWPRPWAKLRGLESLRTKLDDANTSLASAQAENQKDKDQIAALQSKVADLEQDKNAAAQMAKGSKMRCAPTSNPRMSPSPICRQAHREHPRRVMFDSGEAILKPAGESVMRKVAAILAGHPQLKVHVIGHTDNVPIRPEARSRFASNWELSPPAPWRPCISSPKRRTWTRAASGPSVTVNIAPSPTMRPPREEPGTAALPSPFCRMNSPEPTPCRQ